jgi:hypothetical protein
MKFETVRLFINCLTIGVLINIIMIYAIQIQNGFELSPIVVAVPLIKKFW